MQTGPTAGGRELGRMQIINLQILHVAGTRGNSPSACTNWGRVPEPSSHGTDLDGILPVTWELEDQ